MTEDYHHQRLLEDPATFRPPGPPSVVEAWTFSKGEHSVCERKKISEDQIPSWWSSEPTSNPPSSGKAENTAATLKVLLVSDRETLSSDAVDPLPRLSERDSMVLLPLTLSRSTFEFVSSLLKLPKIYLPSLQRRISHCQQFNPDGEGLGAGYGPGYLVQDNVSKWVQSSTFIRNIGSTTYALVAGGGNFSLEAIFLTLKHSLQLLGCPLLLPVVELEVKADYTQKLLDKCHCHMNDFEPDIGFSLHFHVDDDQTLEHRPIERDVFEKHIRRLTTVSGRVGWCKWAGDVHSDLLLFLESELSGPSPRWACSEADVSTLLHKVHYLQNFVRQNKLRAMYIEERRNGYIQTLYNLIAQNDNAENVRLADASVRMAEAGVRSNTAMKIVAEDSKTVALATLRDSAAMRTIAAVTVFFLPATFTATLFSTTFFNFQAPQSSVISKWVWLYGLVTAILTVFTNMFWYSTIRTKDKEIKAKYENAEEIAEVIDIDQKSPEPR